MNERMAIRLVVAGILLIVGFITLIMMFDLVTVSGNQLAVKESWGNGVHQTPYGPRTYWVMPNERLTTYHMGFNVFIMNDSDGEKDKNIVRYRSYEVQSSDSQTMHLSLKVQWKLDPAQIVKIHETIGPNGTEAKLVESILYPKVQRIVKDHATTKDAIDIYAGEGLKDLQKEIEDSLNAPESRLKENGIIIESFLIEQNKLDPEYVKEITQRQVAIVKELRAKQEEKAAMAESLKAKAVAQADYETKVVEAKRTKQVQVTQAEADQEQAILKAEGEKQRVVLQAEADKEQAVLAAEGEKESSELKAASIKALGIANAEAEKLKFSAYSADGADVYAKIEIAKSLGSSLAGIKGYLPHDMQVYTLGENFMKAVENIVGAKAPASTVAK